MFELRIFFTGMVGFMRSQEGRFRAVLLSTKNGKHIHLGNGGHVEVLPHESLLVFVPEAASNSSGQESPGVFRLDDEEVLISPVGEKNGNSGKFKTGVELVKTLPVGQKGKLPKPPKLPKNPKQTRDFSWTADMQRTLDGAGFQLKPEVLDPKPGGLIVSHLTLDRGTVETFQLTKFNGIINALEFRSSANKVVANYTQALSDITLVRVPIDAASLSVSTVQYGTGAKKASVQLRPLSLSGKKTGKKVIDLLMCNISPKLKQGEKVSARAEHFLMYYDLLSNPPGVGDRPIPTIPSVQVSNDSGKQLEPSDLSRVFDAIGGNPGHGGPSRPICNEVNYGTTTF